MKRFCGLILFLSVFISFFYCQTPTQGLIAYYPFDGNANDLSGNNLHGVGNPSLISDRHGNYGKAFYFNGTNYLDMGNRPQFKLYGDLTICFWIKTDNLFSVGRIISESERYQTLANNTLFQVEFRYPDYNKLLVSHENSPQSYHLCNTYSALSNTWTHVAIIRDSKKSEYKIYINGNLSGASSYQYTGGPSGGNNTKFFVGYSPDPWRPGQMNFKGSLDDIIIFNKVLELNEINSIKEFNSLIEPEISNVIINENKELMVPNKLKIQYTTNQIGKVKIFDENNKSLIAEYDELLDGTHIEEIQIEDVGIYNYKIILTNFAGKEVSYLISNINAVKPSPKINLINFNPQSNSVEPVKLKIDYKINMPGTMMLTSIEGLQLKEIVHSNSGEFSVEIPEMMAGEYSFYLSLTNSYGTSYDTLKNYTINELPPKVLDLKFEPEQVVFGDTLNLNYVLSKNCDVSISLNDNELFSGQNKQSGKYSIVINNLKLGLNKINVYVKNKFGEQFKDLFFNVKKAPLTIDTEEINPTSQRINWTSLSNTNYYSIWLREENELSYNEIYNSIQDTSILLNQLKQNTNYFIKVGANIGDNTIFSDSIKINTKKWIDIFYLSPRRPDYTESNIEDYIKAGIYLYKSGRVQIFQDDILILDEDFEVTDENHYYRPKLYPVKSGEVEYKAVYTIDGIKYQHLKRTNFNWPPYAAIAPPFNIKDNLETKFVDIELKYLLSQNSKLFFYASKDLSESLILVDSLESAAKFAVYNLQKVPRGTKKLAIKAINSNGISDILFVDVDIPEIKEPFLKLDQIDNSKVKLSWDDVGADHYNVYLYYDELDSNLTTKIHQGVLLDNEYLYDGLILGRTHFFKVEAVIPGQSKFSLFKRLKIDGGIEINNITTKLGTISDPRDYIELEIISPVDGNLEIQDKFKIYIDESIKSGKNIVKLYDFIPNGTKIFFSVKEVGNSIPFSDFRTIYLDYPSPSISITGYEIGSSRNNVILNYSISQTGDIVIKNNSTTIKSIYQQEAGNHSVNIPDLTSETAYDIELSFSNGNGTNSSSENIKIKDVNILSLTPILDKKSNFQDFLQLKYQTYSSGNLQFYINDILIGRDTVDCAGIYEYPVYDYLPGEKNVKVVFNSDNSLVTEDVKNKSVIWFAPRINLLSIEQYKDNPTSIEFKYQISQNAKVSTYKNSNLHYILDQGATTYTATMNNVIEKDTKIKLKVENINGVDSVQVSYSPSGYLNIDYIGILTGGLIFNDRFETSIDCYNTGLLKIYEGSSSLPLYEEFILDICKNKIINLTTEIENGSHTFRFVLEDENGNVIEEVIEEKEIVWPVPKIRINEILVDQDDETSATLDYSTSQKGNTEIKVNEVVVFNSDERGAGNYTYLVSDMDLPSNKLEIKITNSNGSGKETFYYAPMKFVIKEVSTSTTELNIDIQNNYPSKLEVLVDEIVEKEITPGIGDVNAAIPRPSEGLHTIKVRMLNEDESEVLHEESVEYYVSEDESSFKIISYTKEPVIPSDIEVVYNSDKIGTIKVSSKGEELYSSESKLGYNSFSFNYNESGFNELELTYEVDNETETKYLYHRDATTGEVHTETKEIVSSSVGGEYKVKLYTTSQTDIEYEAEFIPIEGDLSNWVTVDKSSNGGFINSTGNGTNEFKVIVTANNDELRKGKLKLYQKGNIEKYEEIEIEQKPSFKEITYSYNNLGLIDTLRIDGRIEILNEYNKEGLLSKVYSRVDGSIAKEEVGYDYNNLGQVTEVSYSQIGREIKYIYNEDRGWLETIKSTDINSAIDFEEELKYYGNGNIWKQKILNSKINTNEYTYYYSYDGLSRLKESKYNNDENDPRSEKYSYRDDGGLLLKERTDNKLDYVYNPGSHRLSSIVVNGISKDMKYDEYGYGGVENGNGYAIGRGNVTYDGVMGVGIKSFDHRNLALEVEKETEVTTYEYNDSGDRIRKINGEGEEYYLYGVGGNALAVYKNNRLSRVNLYGSGMIGSINFDEKEELGDKEYYIKDHLGSIRTSISSEYGIVTARDYYPYGEELSSYVNREGKYQFTEKERDEETGLDYFGARYYNSKLGLWLGVDPLADFYAGWNPYYYVLNNPLRYIDPNGMGHWDPKTDSYIPDPGEAVLDEVVVTAETDWERSSWKDVGRYVLGTLVGYPNYYEYSIESDGTVNKRQIKEKPALMIGLAPDFGGMELRGGKWLSKGLKTLFSNGSVKGKTIIEIRNLLFKYGFKMEKARTTGYLFTNKLGEQVRIMRRNGKWDLRVMNNKGGWLDEFGNVAKDRASSHGIILKNK